MRFGLIWLVIPPAFAVSWTLLTRGIVWILRPRMAAIRSTDTLLGTPPAVVNLLAHGLLDAPQAAPATLLDLADRGYLELQLMSNDPRETLVHVRRSRPRTALTAYEARVFDRVRHAGTAGAPSLRRIADGLADDGHNWHRQMVGEVREHARKLGLTRPSPDHWSMWLVAIGMMLGLYLGDAFGAAVVNLFSRVPVDFDKMSPLAAVPPMFAGVMGMVIVMILLVARIPQEILTAPGRATARHWGGVRRYLRSYRAFADEPPASVAIWDRYLPYAVALGAAPVAAASIDLGVGRVDTVGVERDGSWRAVQVHYPHWRPSLLARPAETRLVLAVLGLLALAGLAWARAPQIAELAGPIRWSLVGVGALVAARLGYRLLRSLADMALPVRAGGRILRVVPIGTFDDPQGKLRQHWRLGRRPDAMPKRRGDTSVTPAYLVIVDDGCADPLPAWVVPGERSVALRVGSMAHLRGRRWTRTVLDIDVQ